MSLIDDIRRDREAGTPGPWEDDYEIDDEIDFPSFCDIYEASGRRSFHISSVTPIPTGEHHANARRIARVPDMEAALLAAEKLAEAIENLGAWQSYDASRAVIPGTKPPTPMGSTDDAKKQLVLAMDAYREATK